MGRIRPVRWYSTKRPFPTRFDLPATTCSWNCRPQAESGLITQRSMLMDLSTHLLTVCRQKSFGSSYYSPSLLVASGTLPPLKTVTSTSNNMLIRLSSNQATSGYGFLAIYTTFWTKLRKLSNSNTFSWNGLTTWRLIDIDHWIKRVFRLFLYFVSICFAI
jgi:hypothetical protein